MFHVKLDESAELDLEGFRKFEQVQIAREIDTHLLHEPDVKSHKKKRLRPGHITGWELRVGNMRVFYDVDREALLVKVARIGLKKRNKLFLGGEEYTP